MRKEKFETKIVLENLKDFTEKTYPQITKLSVYRIRRKL